jgi:hypothetical protein
MRSARSRSCVMRRGETAWTTVHNRSASLRGKAGIGPVNAFPTPSSCSIEPGCQLLRQDREIVAGIDRANDHRVRDRSPGPIEFPSNPLEEQLGFYFEGFGWHSFRRQNLTLIQEEGASAFEAMAQAGHSRPTMTSQHTIVGLERREHVVLRLQQRLLSPSGSGS